MENTALIDYSNLLYTSLKKIQTSYRMVWLERARLFKEIKDSKAYKYIHGSGYDSWENFCRDPVVGMSRVQANLHIAIYEYYIEKLKLEPEDIEDISISKLETILIHKDRLSEEDQSLALVEAKLLATPDFYESFKERAGLKDDKPKMYKTKLGWVVEFNPETTVKIVDNTKN